MSSVVSFLVTTQATPFGAQDGVKGGNCDCTFGGQDFDPTSNTHSGSAPDVVPGNRTSPAASEKPAKMRNKKNLRLSPTDSSLNAKNLSRSEDCLASPTTRIPSSPTTRLPDSPTSLEEKTPPATTEVSSSQQDLRRIGVETYTSSLAELPPQSPVHRRCVSLPVDMPLNSSAPDVATTTSTAPPPPNPNARIRAEIMSEIDDMEVTRQLRMSLHHIRTVKHKILTDPSYSSSSSSSSSPAYSPLGCSSDRVLRNASNEHRLQLMRERSRHVLSWDRPSTPPPPVLEETEEPQHEEEEQEAPVEVRLLPRDLSSQQVIESIGQQLRNIADDFDQFNHPFYNPWQKQLLLKLLQKNWAKSFSRYMAMSLCAAVIVKILKNAK